MADLELRFSSGEDSLSVRRFSVREALSGLFEVSVWARSPSEDIDLASIVGLPAAFRIASGVTHAARDERCWTGVVSAMEQEQAEETGLSTYHLHIVPSLWLLGQRRNHRVFQHVSAPQIVRIVLDEWGIEATWKIDPARHPRLEYRVQHAETDESFLRRILEEAGISFFFAEEDAGSSMLVFTDAPHAAPERQGGPLRHVENPSSAAQRDFITRVRLLHEVRPRKIVLWDHDFRGKADYRASAETTAGGDVRLEDYRYEPGSFLTEGHRGANTPAADRHGMARADERHGRRRAEAHLSAEEARRARVAFRTNVLDLRPGTVFSIDGHPRADLSPKTRLLVTELSIEGSCDGEWWADGNAVFASHPYCPARSTPKASIHGVESAIVVGPPGEEIHTDEHGRVRVQFHWDRTRAGEHSSCWIRVSQGWAGGAFGMLALPRVGQEVLVAFLGGDPDQPIVVGRVFNGSTPVPYKLPEHKTRSTWKSDSSPGSGGFNELMFEDARGRELVYMQAERDFERLVKRDEVVTVGRNRSTTIGEVDASAVGAKHTVNIKGTPTGTEIVAGRISFTTGAATITIDGPDITLDASSMVTLKAGSNVVIHAEADVTVNGGANVAVKGAANVTVGSDGPATVQAGGGDLVLQGGPMVKVNPGAGAGAGTADSARTPGFEDLRVAVPPDVNIQENIRLTEENALYHPERPTWFWDMIKPGGEWDFALLKPEYEAFTAWHLGFMGAVAGYPEDIVVRQAGKLRGERGISEPGFGHSGNGLWDGELPYGNEPHLYELMVDGHRTYESPEGSTSPDLAASGAAELPVQRLCNVDEWAIHRRVGVQSGRAVHTIATRHDTESGETEYLVWQKNDQWLAAGSIHHPRQEGRRDEPSQDEIDAILNEESQRHQVPLW